LKLRKYPRAEIDVRVHRAAKILGIEALLDRKPKAISGGQRQRVALGRAIVRQPKVFLFDEPLSNLDANLRAQMRTEISRLHQQLQTTMIYVTHDQVEAMSMGERIVVIKDGIVQQVDTPLRIYHHPKNQFVASFIGSPTMNFMTGLIDGDNRLAFRQEGSGFSLPLPPAAEQKLRGYAGRMIMLGIRPEHIYAQKPAGIQTLASFSATVDVVEPVGNEVFVHFSTGTNTDYVARLTTDAPPEAGRLCELFCDFSRMHFFDIESGQAL
jgi:multiple sugar transport system ATP-binding protein